VKATPWYAWAVTEKRWIYSCNPFATSVLERGGWVLSQTWRSTFRKGPQYPLYSRLDGPWATLWTGAENLVFNGIRIPDPPAHKVSPYRLQNPSLQFYKRVSKSRRMRWAGHVARMGEDSSVYRVLVGKPEGKKPLGRPRRRWEDNIKMDLQKVGGGRGDWMELAQDRDRWRPHVGTVRDFRVP
jgi:hypothetical protein